MYQNMYEKKLEIAQVRFNQIIAPQPLCQPKIRLMAFFAIVQMGVLKRKILQEQNLADIEQFNRIKHKLDILFEKLSNEMKGKKHAQTM